MTIKWNKNISKISAVKHGSGKGCFYDFYYIHEIDENTHNSFYASYVINNGTVKIQLRITESKRGKLGFNLSQILFDEVIDTNDMTVAKNMLIEKMNF